MITSYLHISLWLLQFYLLKLDVFNLMSVLLDYFKSSVDVLLDCYCILVGDLKGLDSAINHTSPHSTAYHSDIFAQQCKLITSYLHILLRLSQRYLLRLDVFNLMSVLLDYFRNSVEVLFNWY